MLTIAQLLALTHLEMRWQNERAVMLGLAFGLLAEHPEMASRCLGWHYQRILRAIELRQLAFHFDRFGRSCGHVWWTRVSPTSENNLLKFGPHVLDADGFSDEGEAWVLDFRASLGELPNALLALRDTLPSGCGTLTYCRYKQGRRITKQISRHNDSSLLRHLPRPEHDDDTVWLGSDQGKSVLSSVRSSLEMWIQGGLILELLVKSPRYAGMPLFAAMGRIRSALATRQYRLLRSPDGAPLAYYSWLWRESTALASAMPLHELELPDWRDGRDALLGDAVAIREGANTLRDELSAFAQNRWWVYPENGTAVRSLMTSRECLSLAALDAEICDFTASNAMHVEVSTCRI